MNQLETQTQIVSAATACEWPNDPPLWTSPTGYLMVCLCDVAPNDYTFGNGWLRCKTHDAVKLASMNGLSVLLHVRNERGEIVPVRGEE